MKRSIGLALAVAALSAGPVQANSAAAMVAGYAQEASRTQPGFTASAERGRAFFTQKWNVSARLPNCAACHTEQPTAAGTHAITAKPIRPLAPAANAERFSDGAKTEKWFRRNCSEVVGRECSAAEKADLVQFLLSAGGAR